MGIDRCVFGICEITKFTLGIIIAKKLDEVNGAKWYHLRNDDGVHSVPIDERSSCKYFDVVLRRSYDNGTCAVLRIFRQDTYERSKKTTYIEDTSTKNKAAEKSVAVFLYYA